MTTLPSTETNRSNIVEHPVPDIPEDASVDVSEVLDQSQVMEVLQKLDKDLVGLKSVKARIHEIKEVKSLRPT